MADTTPTGLRKADEFAAAARAAGLNTEVIVESTGRVVVVVTGRQGHREATLRGCWIPGRTAAGKYDGGFYRKSIGYLGQRVASPGRLDILLRGLAAARA